MALERRMVDAALRAFGLNVADGSLGTSMRPRTTAIARPEQVTMVEELTTRGDGVDVVVAPAGRARRTRSPRRSMPGSRLERRPRGGPVSPSRCGAGGVDRFASTRWRGSSWTSKRFDPAMS